MTTRRRRVGADLQPRRMVQAAVGLRNARISVIPNGSTMTLADVKQLAVAAALAPVVSRREVILPIESLPDFEAMAELRHVSVRRVKPHRRAG